MAARHPGSWTIRIVRPDTHAPAPAVPVTVLDNDGAAIGHWVSDASGVVRVPRAHEDRLRVRVGLRTETPIDLDAFQLRTGPVELPAPASVLPALSTSPVSDDANQEPVPGAPPQVFRFHRVGMFAGKSYRSTYDVTSQEATVDPVSAAGLPPVDFFNVPVNQPTPMRYGVVLEVDQTWHPLGYVLGDLLYSLPLAPDDEGRIELVDRRTSPDGAAEPTGPMPHDLVSSIADRGITDVSPDADGALPVEACVLSAAARPRVIERAASEVAALLNDRIERRCHLLRTRRAFAVREVTEQTGAGAVRVLRNPHRDRTITYQYFETLERYRIRADVTRVRPAILVPFRMPNLATTSAVRQYGYILRRVLLDPSLQPELDRILGAGDEPESDVHRVTEIRLVGQVAPGEAALDLWQASVTFRVGDVRYQLRFAPAETTTDQFSDSDVPSTAHWLGAVRPVDFQRHPIRPGAPIAVENRSMTDLVFERLVVEGRIGDVWESLQGFRAVTLPGQSRLQLMAVPGAGDQRAEDSPLLAHVAANLPHYSAAIITAGDPALRFLALAKMRDARGAAIGDIIENRVVGVLGNYIAFPLRATEDLPSDLREAFSFPPSTGYTTHETVVTVPTPGAWLKTTSSSLIGGRENAQPAAALPGTSSLERRSAQTSSFERRPPDWDSGADVTQAG